MSWQFYQPEARSGFRLKIGLWFFTRSLLLLFKNLIFKFSSIKNMLGSDSEYCKNYVWKLWLCQNDKRHPKWLSKQQKIEQLTCWCFYVIFICSFYSFFVQKHLPTIRDLQKESYHSEKAQIEKLELLTECSTNLMFSHHGTKMSKLICWWYFDGIKFLRAMERSCKWPRRFFLKVFL